MATENDHLLGRGTAAIESVNSNSLGASNNNNNGNGDTIFDIENLQHLKTYTAGEDASRLAIAAKELGLAKQRTQRQQVRSVGVSFSQVILPALAGMEEPASASSSDRRRGTTKPNQNMWELLAGVAGNVLEWYDFAVFGYFGDIIGQVFFPPQEGSKVRNTHRIKEER